MISKRAFLHSAAGLATATLGVRWLTPALAADAYPAHAVRWIVPYAAGGATDVLSRLICQYLSDRLTAIEAEKRERLDEGAPAGHDLGPAAREQIERGEVLEDADGIA